MRIHAPICTINDAPDRTQPFKTLRGNQAGKLMIATRAYTHEKRKQLTWNKRIKKNGKTWLSIQLASRKEWMKPKQRFLERPKVFAISFISVTIHNFTHLVTHSIQTKISQLLKSYTQALTDTWTPPPKSKKKTHIDQWGGCTMKPSKSRTWREKEKQTRCW